MDLVFFAVLEHGQDPERLRPNEEAAALRWWTRAELAAATHAGTLPTDVITMALAALEQAASA
jgi:hypothetical protein